MYWSLHNRYWSHGSITPAFGNQVDRVRLKKTTMSLVASAATSDGAFDSIPVMCVESSRIPIDRLLNPLSDIGDASTPERRVALAHEVRNACMNVGFFYSEHRSSTFIYAPILHFINVDSHWTWDTAGDHRQPVCDYGGLLLTSTRDQDEGNMATRPSL